MGENFWTWIHILFLDRALHSVLTKLSQGRKHKRLAMMGSSAHLSPTILAEPPLCLPKMTAEALHCSLFSPLTLPKNKSYKPVCKGGGGSVKNEVRSSAANPAVAPTSLRGKATALSRILTAALCRICVSPVLPCPALPLLLRLPLPTFPFARWPPAPQAFLLFLQQPDILLPQGLCICYSFCLEGSSP